MANLRHGESPVNAGRNARKAIRTTGGEGAVLLISILGNPVEIEIRLRNENIGVIYMLCRRSNSFASPGWVSFII